MAIRRTARAMEDEVCPYSAKQPGLRRAWAEGYAAALDGAIADDGAGGVVIPDSAWERIGEEAALARAITRLPRGRALVRGPGGDWFAAPVEGAMLGPCDEQEYGGYDSPLEALDMAGDDEE